MSVSAEGLLRASPFIVFGFGLLVVGGRFYAVQAGWTGALLFSAAALPALTWHSIRLLRQEEDPS